MTSERRQGERYGRGGISRGRAAVFSGLVGGAVGMALGTRLRRVFGGRGASDMFEGTPCSTLPAEGGGDPVAGSPAPAAGSGAGGADRRPDRAS